MRFSTSTDLSNSTSKAMPCRLLQLSDETNAARSDLFLLHKIDFLYSEKVVLDSMLVDIPSA